MLTHIFMQANRDPTIMIGGFLPLLGAGHRVGKGDTIILESCEYCNSFLNFFPTAAVILDVDADHLDFFKDLQDVERSFRKFASLVPADGLIVANGDDKIPATRWPGCRICHSASMRKTTCTGRTSLKISANLTFSAAGSRMRTCIWASLAVTTR